MQDLIKISSKGQIVIPKQLRQEADIHSGDLLLVEWDGEQLKIRKVSNPSYKPDASLVRELLGKYRTDDKKNPIRENRENLYGKIN